MHSSRIRPSTLPLDAWTWMPLPAMCHTVQRDTVITDTVCVGAIMMPARGITLGGCVLVGEMVRLASVTLPSSVDTTMP